MSTLAEIESAAAALPIEEQKVLHAHLGQRLERARVSEATPATSCDDRSARGFPVSQGRAAFSTDEVAKIEAEADARG